MLSIQQANEIAKEIASEFGVSAPPPIYVTPKIPPAYAGAYYHNGGTHIKIRPEYFTERTVAHETGHHVFHERAPGVCQGQNPQCEELAQMIEKWWVHKRSQERKYIDGQSMGGKVIAFTLNKPMTLEQAKQVAEHLRESEIGESIDRVGGQDRYFYVVMKPVDGVDGLIPLLMPVILAALALVGLSVVAWTQWGIILQPGPLGLPNIFWILVAGAGLFVALGWALSRLKK